MTKTPIYTYMGANGTVTTPIEIEGVNCIKKIILTAAPNKRLTRDRVHFYDSVIVPEKEIKSWIEISGQK